MKMKVENFRLKIAKDRPEDSLPVLVKDKGQDVGEFEHKNIGTNTSSETPIHPSIQIRELKQRLRNILSTTPNTINMVYSLNLSDSTRRPVCYKFKKSLPIRNQRRNLRLEQSEEPSLISSPSENISESAWYNYKRLNLSRPKLSRYSAANTIKKISLSSKLTYKPRQSKTNNESIDYILKHCRSTERSPVLRNKLLFKL